MSKKMVTLFLIVGSNIEKDGKDKKNIRNLKKVLTFYRNSDIIYLVREGN
ncbi:hypothetical protein PM10SUCC1_38040 [Propionigenium maris DSM 9537]|uniref:Uncharacterized protein n=1 Tax=Propionigenium maris DSM 9537 TaxID=1123000 RepID=A0A9W6GQ42_9FUSO|nr:hypothetical protein PM10SUCC1_38040 [Propionigenium maris DSM 9537]